jgi:uncharacterized peroxidase-related enzyme
MANAFSKDSAMSTRIAPVNFAGAEGRPLELLTAVKTKLGMIPNAVKTMAQSPAVLEGYLSLAGALKKGVLPASTREQIALSVSQTNGCEYCLSAHSITGKMAGLKPEQLLDARRGKASDPKAQAVLNLTQHLLERRGNVSDEQLTDARRAGLTDAELVEVVGNISVITLSNFLNQLAHTDIDFPRVTVSL